MIDWDALWQTVWTASLAGVGVVVIYSIAVLGAGRSLELRGQASSWLYAVLALLGGAGTIAAITWGIILITSK